MCFSRFKNKKTHFKYCKLINTGFINDKKNSNHFSYCK